MKMSISFFFLFVISCSSSFAQRGSRLLVDVQANNQEHRLEVRLANLQGLATRVALFDWYGHSWFSEYARNSNGYSKGLTLRGMPDGTYILLIENRGAQAFRTFKKESGDIHFFHTNETHTSTPSYARRVAQGTGTAGQLIANIQANGPRKLDVQLANLLGQSTQIRLTSHYGTTIVAKSIAQENGYAESWNFEGLAAGCYFICIQHQDTKIIQLVRISQTGIELLGQLTDPNNTTKLHTQWGGPSGLPRFL